MSVTNVGKKILIVDDEDSILRLMRVFLEDEGFETTLCKDPDLVHLIMKSESIDAIICDFLMPGKNGLECISSIRKEFGEKLPIVMITGSKDLALDQVLAVGGNALLNKPIDFIKLSEVLDSSFNLLKEDDSSMRSHVQIRILTAEKKTLTTAMITEISSSQIVFQLEKGFSLDGENYFFEVFVNAEDEKIYFPFKGKNIKKLPDGPESIFSIEPSLYDEELFVKVLSFHRKQRG